MKKNIIFLILGLLFTNVLVAQTCPQTGAVIIPTTGQNSSSLPFTSYNGVNIIVNGDFVIDNNFTAINCTFYVADNVAIIVENNALAFLILNNCDLFSCGNVMWDGILVKLRGNIDMTNSTLEDAKIGVHTFAFVGIVNIVDNDFNKNHIHIKAEQSNGANMTLHGNDFTCQNSPNPFSFNGNTLEQPYLNGETEIAFWGVSTTLLNIGLPNGNLNLFKDCNFGIRLDDCDAIIKNNQFQSITKNIAVPFNQPYPYYQEQTAITAYSFVKASIIEVGGLGINEPNTFRNCNYGVDINACLNVKVNGNVFLNNLPLPSLTQQGSGTNGIIVSIVNNYNNTHVEINSNNFTDFSNPIRYYNANQTVILNDFYDISDNIIDGTVNYKGRTGITVVGNNNVVDYKEPFSSATILNNEIKDFQTGITLTGATGLEPEVSNNEIKISWRNSSSGYGIEINGCTNPIIIDNKITGRGIDFNNKDYIGIRTQMSDLTVLFCNKIFDFGQSMHFIGFTPSFIMGNVFKNAYDGFVMGVNGITGPIGTPVRPSDNKWMGQFTRSKTFTINQNCNIHSPFYLRGGGLFFPQVGTNLTDPLNSIGQEYNTNAPNSGLNQVFPPGPIFQCSHIFNFPFLQLNQETVREKLSFKQFIPHSKWISKKEIYQQILMDSSLLQDPIIDSFALAGTNQYSYLHSIENEISIKDYTQAITLSNAFNATNLPEENYQYFYKIYSTYFSVHQLSQSDYDKLVEIAEQCPLDGGKAVFESRVLRDYIDKNSYDYDDVCEELENRKFTENTSSEIQNQFDIYPNPNNGLFILSNQTDGILICKVYDLYGKFLMGYIMNSNSSIQADLTEFADGIYLYEAINSINNISKNGKFIIIR